MLFTEIIRPNDIAPSFRDSMFKIMDRYYRNVNRENFESDLNEKTYVILLKDHDTIIGFTTLLLWDISIDDVPVKGLYSGDTIVERVYWGQTQLQSALGKLMIHVSRQYPDIPVYWMLSSKGYKTYCMLPLYFLHFYPAYCQETPDFEKKLIDRYGSLKFGKAYNPETGIAINLGERDFLREGVADPTQDRLSNKHIAFFLERNPGYRSGDELICVAKIAKSNVRPVVRRFEQHG